MIDPLVEDLITPAEATSLYPRGPQGKKVHVSKVYRDMNRGVRGIFLESIKTPRLATSRQAVARIFRRLTEVSQSGTSQVRQDAARGRSQHQVEQELDRLGI